MKFQHIAPLIMLLSLLIVSCGNSEHSTEISETNSNVTQAQSPSISYVSDYIDNTSPDGRIINYSLCKTNQPGFEHIVRLLYNKDKKQLEYDKQKQTEAQNSGKPFKNTWSRVRSAELVNTCPAGENARCEVSNIITSYYTDSPVALVKFNKNCALLPANIWTENP